MLSPWIAASKADVCVGPITNCGRGGRVKTSQNEGSENVPAVKGTILFSRRGMGAGGVGGCFSLGGGVGDHGIGLGWCASGGEGVFISHL
jgi:hypothetical protein